jgi:hypothetical protein
VRAVTCEIQYSGPARAAVVIAAIATGALAFAMPLQPLLQVLAILWVLLLACRALRRLDAVTAIRLDAEGAIAIREAGSWHEGAVRAGSVALPWLTAIRWRPAGARFDRALLLLPSMLAPDDFRALRVLLRWSKP